VSASTDADWPATDLVRVMACPACGEPGRTLMHSHLHDPLFATPGHWDLWRCASCGSGYLDPRPTLDSAGRAYETYFTHEEPAPQPVGSSRFARFRRGVLHGYLNSRYGYRLEPALELGRLLLPLVPHAVPRTDRFIRHLHHTGRRPSLLDLGCGNGAFLVQMRDMGWRVHGLDTDARALEEAERAGLEVTHGTLEDLEAAGPRYDAITLGHVIEHLPDPLDALRRTCDLLRPGGMVWLATPNVEALGHRLFGRDWYAVDAPRHLSLFTQRALGDLLRRAGFERVEALKPGPDAGALFRPSSAIASGGDPLDESAQLSPGLRLRAALAVAVSRRRWDAAEELMFAAWAPR
jgi:SAM-dependent methyltransferase